jgi:hypothetical protein
VPFRPPRVVFVLGLGSLINSLTSGKIKAFFLRSDDEQLFASLHAASRVMPPVRPPLLQDLCVSRDSAGGAQGRGGAHERGGTLAGGATRVRGASGSERPRERR